MLAVISSYFNPNRCHYRLANYNRFRDQLRKEGVDLFTFELAFGDDEFEIEAKEEHLTQAHTQDLMFQKERMLNILLESLPSKYDNVCWMDCDMFYVQEGWSNRIEEKLKEHIVIQPWAWAAALPHGDWAKIGLSHVQAFNCSGSCNFRRSFAYYHQHRTTYVNFHDGHVGYIWAARRNFLDKFKFYDSIVTGCGDLFMAMAYVGNFVFLDHDPSIKNMKQSAMNHFFDWGLPTVEYLLGDVGYTEDLVLHMWHGDLNKRNYLGHSRHLETSDFDPNDDLELDENGLWKWKRSNPKLRDFIKRMFDLQKTDPIT